MSKLEDTNWKRIIAKLIDRIEINSDGKKTKATKLDICMNYNFNSIAEKDIIEIIYSWANGGIGRRARFRS